MITKTDLSVSDAAETLTGYEEDFIAEHFDGAVVEDLLMQRSRDGLRAIAACLVARELSGDDAQDKALQHVKGLSMKQLNDFFAEDVEEAMPDEPDSEPGKGDSAAAS